MKKILKDDNQKTKSGIGVPYKVIIKVASKVMITCNIDHSIGLLNGTIGTVKCISKDSNGCITTITFQKENGQEHEIPRFPYRFFVMDNIFVTRNQFPIISCYGISIHRSQGLSLKHIVIDVGNNIFACGQSYVALSRGTSAEGVYIINLDPAEIKASNDAILEYNRLRSLFRNDLPTIDLQDDKKLKKFKVNDINWMIKKAALEIQNNNEHALLIDTDNWKVVGIRNHDGVSCYANASLQSLFNTKCIRNKLLLNKDFNAIVSLCNLYDQNQSPNSAAFKKVVDAKYNNGQEDAVEFISDICNKFTIVEQTVNFQLTIQRRCLLCQNRTSETTDSIILGLEIPESTNTFELSDIFDHNIGTWKTLVDVPWRCNDDRPCNGEKQEKTTIPTNNDVIICTTWHLHS